MSNPSGSPVASIKPRSRGLSPFRSRGKSPQHNKSRGKSPFRSLSPFRRNSFDDNIQHSVPTGVAKKPNVMVCHQSAHAIVFRDHLRLARKIIQEIDEDDLDDEGDLDSVASESSSGSGSSSSDSESGEAAFANLRSARQSIRASVRDSVRNSLTTKESEELVHEINDLAHSLVPELKNAQFQLANVSERNVEIEGLHAHITPLDELELKASHDFEALLESKEPNSDHSWTPAEIEVFQMIQQQKACVKTIKNSEWPSFLKRFLASKKQMGLKHAPTQHDDIGPRNGFPFNSFVTSTTLLPENGLKMRSYGSNHAYNVGVVFALPDMNEEDEVQAQNDTKTWSWPAGYAAKTEFNISHGKLINGREEALASLKQLRQYNEDYLHKQDHMIAGKLIKGGFSVVPYNEVFLRVGGRGRIVQSKDVVTGEERNDREGTGRSFEVGVGLFCALFIRSITMGDIISLFRTRARIANILGKQHLKQIPLLYIHHEHGVRVLSDSLQRKFWKLVSHKLQPFKNPILSPTLSYYDTNETTLQTKLQELLELPPKLQKALNHQELSHIAGGFGVTDECISDLLYNHSKDANELQEIMTSGLASAIRAGDHYAARQLLILYTMQVSHVNTGKREPISVLKQPATTYSNIFLLNQKGENVKALPPPIDTKRLRRAVS